MGKAHLVFLWHFHQPPYKDPFAGPSPDLALPWVRLHGARAYYQMGELTRRFPRQRFVFNFTPVLLDQIRGYAESTLRDRLMTLSLRDFSRLTEREAEYLITRAFDVHFENRIKPHPRYFKLFRKFQRGEGFSTEEARDAVALFNLAWLGDIFLEGPVQLASGDVVDARGLWDKGGGYLARDVEEVLSYHVAVLRAIIPLYRALQAEGRVEVSTTPYFHPILPLLHDSDDARIDRPGSRHPRRFSRPQDAAEQVRRAVVTYERYFGQAPYGMWPAEGAVGEGVMGYFQDAGVAWVATDEGVLALSDGGRRDPRRPEVLFRPYRLREQGPAIFFRHRGLSDGVGFVYQQWRDQEAAAADLVGQIRSLAGEARARTVRDVVISVILDGENPWGAYPATGVPFLTALYEGLNGRDCPPTVTFREYLEGDVSRDISPHPLATLDDVASLACASWIDEAGSMAGNDLGTWIGEPEENAAWDLLNGAGETYDAATAAPAAKERAREHLLAAEASDWFWWYGDDQGGGADEEFDRLFRGLVQKVYEELGVAVPPAVTKPIAPRRVVWRADITPKLVSGDLLVVEWPCPGGVRFGVNGWQNPQQRPLAPSQGVMGVRRGVFRAALLRVTPDVRRVEFTFHDEKGAWLGYDFFIRVGQDLV